MVKIKTFSVGLYQIIGIEGLYFVVLDAVYFQLESKCSYGLHPKGRQIKKSQQIMHLALILENENSNNNNNNRKELKNGSVFFFLRLYLVFLNREGPSKVR